MAYNFSSFKAKVAEIEEWLAREFSTVRTGRATPALLDSVMVESYGAKTPIKHVANISIDDPKTLKVSPWDTSQIRAIETAIAQANLGISTSPDGTGVRVIFPDLTAERRQMLIKVAKEKFEDARISLRKERERAWNEIQDQEKAGEIGEDEKFRAKEELQKYVDEANARFESLMEKKENEIKS